MLTAPIYRPTEEAIAELVCKNPFGLVISNASGDLNATPLPLLLERESAGGQSLVGHFGRANPQVGLLERTPRALFVFQGAHGYISPSWMQDRTQAPTWNFMTVHFHADVVFHPDLDEALLAVDKLASAMEHGRPCMWVPEEMGDRRAQLARGVIAFRARVVRIDAKFKLGQNEQEDVLHDILAGLQETRQGALLAAMRAANSSRLEGRPLGVLTEFESEDALRQKNL